MRTRLYWFTVILLVLAPLTLLAPNEVTANTVRPADTITLTITKITSIWSLSCTTYDGYTTTYVNGNAPQKSGNTYVYPTTTETILGGFCTPLSQVATTETYLNTFELTTVTVTRTLTTDITSTTLSTTTGNLGAVYIVYKTTTIHSTETNTFTDTCNSWDATHQLCWIDICLAPDPWLNFVCENLPGFPIESILAGLIIGLSIVLFARRVRSAGSRTARKSAAKASWPYAQLRPCWLGIVSL